jgi:TetR/AcrR family transcriptional regulator
MNPPNTEQLIKEAARRVFTAKGLAATRTEDIAQEAGVNKALVNYYYRSKNRLFEAVFEEEMDALAQNREQILTDERLDIFEKLRLMVELDMELIQRNPGLPLFVINEMAKNPYLVGSCQGKVDKDKAFRAFCQQIEIEIQRGNLKPIDPRMLWMNIVSLVTLPFVAQAWMASIIELDPEAYTQLMEQRKRHIADFIIQSIRCEAQTSTASNAESTNGK